MDMLPGHRMPMLAQAAAEQASEAQPDQAAQDDDAAAVPPEAARGTTIGGLGANLVSTVRSFLPFVSRAADAPPPPPAAGKKPVKVRDTLVLALLPGRAGALAGCASEHVINYVLPTLGRPASGQDTFYLLAFCQPCK